MRAVDFILQELSEEGEWRLDHLQGLIVRTQNTPGKLRNYIFTVCLLGYV